MGKTTNRASTDLKLTLFFFGANSENSVARASIKMAYFPSRRDELVSHNEINTISPAGTQYFGCFRFFKAAIKASVKQVVATKVQLDVFTDDIK